MAKETVAKELGIVCHFQEFHSNYYDAFEYVRKHDSDYVTSTGLSNSPQTKNASRKRLSSEADVRERTATASIPNKSKRDKLDNLKVYDIIVR